MCSVTRKGSRELNEKKILVCYDSDGITMSVVILSDNHEVQITGSKVQFEEKQYQYLYTASVENLILCEFPQIL